MLTESSSALNTVGSVWPLRSRMTTTTRRLPFWFADIGLLEVVSILLAVLGILMALAAVWAFFNVRATARTAAMAAAKEAAEEIAERCTNEYLQLNIRIILTEYAGLGLESANDEQADEIAQAQEDGKEAQ